MYSRKISLSFVCSLIFGCSGPAQAPISSLPLNKASQTLLALSEQRPCRDPSALEYLNSLTSLLQIPLHRAKKYDLRLTSFDEPLSVFIPPATILISGAFIKQLPSEAALSFVLAHEIGHDVLGHHNLEDATKQEEEADTFALSLVKRSGFSSPQALEALRQFADRGGARHHGLTDKKVATALQDDYPAPYWDTMIGAERFRRFKSLVLNCSS
jgi:predicted Zn-dependent protease